MTWKSVDLLCLLVPAHCHYNTPFWRRLPQYRHSSEIDEQHFHFLLTELEQCPIIMNSGITKILLISMLFQCGNSLTYIKSVYFDTISISYILVFTWIKFCLIYWYCINIKHFSSYIKYCLIRYYFNIKHSNRIYRYFVSHTTYLTTPVS